MIELLEQHVANQIAAGEVVQRPASIVKELLENSVDAGSMSITLMVEDGGRTLIRVVDNGIGMSQEDAVKSFLRHATSKIRTADDLFNLHTFGFRGEALASISSVSEVEMLTCRAQDEIGTQVNINGGSKPIVTAVSTPRGTGISVRNLFFNTPARRKFLKSTATENRQIITEFQRVALVNPDIEFRLVIDGKQTLSLSPGNLHQRIVAITSKVLGTRLLSLESDTAFAKISGYVGTPAAARKQAGEQYFFVNGRFMRNPYLQKAVVNGYGKLLTADQYPSFFIYIEVEPSKLDVNIHPTKSEVKFEDEHAIWQVLSSTVRQTLGRHNIVPALDFENENPVEIPVYNASESYAPPKIVSKTGYDPFKSYDTGAWEQPAARPVWGDDPQRAPFVEQIPDYLKFTEGNAPQQEAEPQPVQSELPMDIETSFGALQWSCRYVITTTSDGILVIDYPRAMQRIAYEQILLNDHFTSHSEGQLHPEVIELSAMEHRLVMDSEDEISALGFTVGNMGGTTIAIHALPAELVGKVSAEEAVEALLAGLTSPTQKDNRRQTLARLVTKNISRTTPRILRPTEISALLSDLLATDEPSYTPDGLPIIEIINPKELFKK